MAALLRIFFRIIIHSALVLSLLPGGIALGQPGLPGAPSMAIPWENTALILFGILGYGLLALERSRRR